MSKLCRQVSIESPGPCLKDCVFSFDIPIPDVPMFGARIRVLYAGACYKLMKSRSASVSSSTSISSIGSLSGESENYGIYASTPARIGLKDGALFPGYEVAGVVDAIGKAAERVNCIKEGSRIVLYPYDGVPAGYAEYIVVPDLKSLVAVPDELPLSVAAMLPTGALSAMNTVTTTRAYLHLLLSPTRQKSKATVLIVGTGGLALWTFRILTHYLKKDEYNDKVKICVATLNDEGLMLSKECGQVNVIQWNEVLYETQLIERTVDACNGLVDIVINFGSSPRVLNRSMLCLSIGGVVLVTQEVASKYIAKFTQKAEDLHVQIREITNGTIEQLKELVEIVARAEIEPPPFSIFPAEEAQEVIRKLSDSEIYGRAILKFHDDD